MKLFPERGGKFSLIGVAYTDGDLGDRILRICEKFCRSVHAGFPQIGRDILSVYTPEIIFEAGFTDRKLLRKKTDRIMTAKVRDEDFPCLLCNCDLSFCEKAFKSGRMRFLLQKMMKEFKGAEFQGEI